MKGVLGSFGRAFILRSNDNSCLLFREDLRQFLILMETVVGYYKTEETNQQTEVNIPEKSNKQKLSYFENYRFRSFFYYLALINLAGGLYGRILTEVVCIDRTQ